MHFLFLTTFGGGGECWHMDIYGRRFLRLELSSAALRCACSDYVRSPLLASKIICETHYFFEKLMRDTLIMLINESAIFLNVLL